MGEFLAPAFHSIEGEQVLAPFHELLVVNVPVAYIMLFLAPSLACFLLDIGHRQRKDREVFKDIHRYPLA
jgi:hypothetical protein